MCDIFWFSAYQRRIDDMYRSYADYVYREVKAKRAIDVARIGMHIGDGMFEITGKVSIYKDYFDVFTCTGIDAIYKRLSDGKVIASPGPNPFPGERSKIIWMH